MSPRRHTTLPPRLAALIAAITLLATTLSPAPSHAEPSKDRVTAGGYFRVMARPDMQGGASRLGLWNLYGRLLNEGPWAALELKLDALQPTPGTSQPWTSLHAKIEGGSLLGADPSNGSLGNYGLTQLYVRAGNVLLEDVTWQMGSLHTYFGDLGLYDARPAELFYETVGLSATYKSPYVDVLIGGGDAGYTMHRDEYSTVLSVGGSVRVRPVSGLEFGLGGQYFHEPKVVGNRFAPHTTALPDGVAYEDYLRGRIVERFQQNTGMSIDQVRDQFPKPEPVSAASSKLVAYLGFGGFGPLTWNNLFANFIVLHPETSYTENVQGTDFDIYVADLTDERTQINIGNEMQLTVVPGWVDVVWGTLFGLHKDGDNTISASERDRTFWSTVLQGQFYVTDTVHILVEGAYASELSDQGNLWRGHYDSVFTSEDGITNTDGLEFGDLDTRTTWQAKGGVVFNPTGAGIFARPSIRLLYGMQNSNMHNAFGNSFVSSLDAFNEFRETEDRHVHQIISLEAEAWF